MNQNNSHQIFVIDGSAALSQPVNSSLGNIPAGVLRRRIKKNRQQPVVDVIVVLVALPTLTILALLLEANTRSDWLATTRSRFTVFGLGITLAVVCLAICMYITSRIGGKMWTGAIPSDGNGPHYSYYGSRSTVNDLSDKPPAYDVVMGFDIPPPPYHTIIIEESADSKDIRELESCSKFNSIQHM